MKQQFMKLLFGVFFALVLYDTQAQVTPAEYDAAYAAAMDKYKIAMFQGWDVVLHPDEQVALLANSLTLATGNWGPEYLGINVRASEILSKAKRKVAVFVLDTGDGYNQSQLSKAAWNERGKDFTGSSGDKSDGNGHSTHCAGIIGSSDPGTPLGAARMLADAGWLKIIPYQVLNDAGSGSFAWIKAGILDATLVGKQLQAEGWAVVFSLSLGGNVTSLPADMEAALKAANEAGIYIAVAAGNTGGTPVQYPGKSPWVSAVGALAQTAAGGVERAPYSSYGPELFCAMPGSLILSTYKGSLALLSGTSMATPHEAAVAAILLCLNPGTNGGHIKAHLQKYATDLPPTGKDNYTGYGVHLINPLIDNPISGSPPPPPPPPVDTTKKERVVNVYIKDLVNNWRNYSSGTMQKLYFSYTLAVKTRLSDEAIYDKVLASCQDLYSRSGLVLADGDGYAAATYYTGRFAELLLKQQYGLTVTCASVTGMDSAGRVTSWEVGQDKPIQAANRFMRAASEYDLRRTYIRRGLWRR